MSTITVSVMGNYRKSETTVRAKLVLTKNGAQCASIGSRQIKTAADRCCYAGIDYPVFSQIPGYTEWYQIDSGIAAYKL